MGIHSVSCNTPASGPATDYQVGDSGPVSDMLKFHQLSNALWLAMKEYQDNPNAMTAAAEAKAFDALSAFLNANVPASGDSPAYDVYTALQDPLHANLFKALNGVASGYADQSNTTYRGYFDKLLGDLKEYDWEMGLPPGQQDPLIIQGCLKGIAEAINNLVTQGGSITDGYLTSLLAELGAPIGSGPSLATLAANVVSGADPNGAALQKVLASLGETGDNGGALRYWVEQVASYEYSES